MPAKARKATMRKKLKKKAASISSVAALANKAAAATTTTESAAADFLPLEGGPARKPPKQQQVEKSVHNAISVFHMDSTRMRCETGKSKHYGFIEFVSPEVSKIVADCMHNYLLFEHMLQVHLIPPERVHPKLWKGVDRRYTPPNWIEIARKRHNKERTVEEHRKLIDGVLKKDLKQRRKIEAAGIDYVPPEIIGSIQPAPKKFKFDED